MTLFKNNSLNCWRICIYIVSFLLLNSSVFADVQEQQFKIVEHFGVSHPAQVVTFEIGKLIIPENCYLLNEAGEEVPFQLITGGKYGTIAFVTDLPAKISKTFTLMSGRPPKGFAHGVSVDETNANYIEITNGLTGVRVPKPYAPLQTNGVKSPFQGIRFRDGSWSAAGTPVLFGDIRYNNTKISWEGIPQTIDTMTVNFLEKGHVKTIIQVEYKFKVGDWKCYCGKYNHPEGTAHYRMTIEIQQGEPIVLCEVDTDYMSSTSFSFYDAVKPTDYRYRGHGANDTTRGKEADGSRYNNGYHDHDCQPIQIDYNKDITTCSWPGMSRIHADGDRPGVNAWNPWQQSGGWVENMYQSKGSAESNTVSIIAGAASRLIAGSFANAGFYSNKKPDAGFMLETDLRSGSDNHAYHYSKYKTIRYPFGIFVGSKAADMPDDVFAVHTAIKQYARHGGGLNLDKLIKWKLEFSDPVDSFGAMYMPKEEIIRMRDRCRNDEKYYLYLVNNEPFSRDIWDMWRDTSGAKTHAMAAAIHTEISNYINEWANYNGYFSCKFTTQNWLIPPPKLDRIDQLLGSEYLSVDEKRQLKADAAFLANWLWDYDAYPLKFEDGQVTSGVSMGSPNMPGQWIGARNSFTWFLAAHPVISTHLDEALPGLWMINDYGAPNTCPHYTGSVTSQFNVIMRREKLGMNDWKKEVKLTKFADWYLNIMTPPDVRYGGMRAVLSDGNSEPCENPTIFGEMATACQNINPLLSRRLMWIWKNTGTPQSGFYGSTVLRINDNLPVTDPQLGNASYPGYMAVLRNSWNTPLETSVHCINGAFYSDHRDGSSGNLHIFALGVPLSLDWESMYNPIVASAAMHSMIVPESSITAAKLTWNGDIVPKDGHYWIPGDPWDWSSQRQESFTSFTTCGQTRLYAECTKVLNWVRQVISIHPNPDYPLIAIRDTFGGKDANMPMTFNMTQLATGEVGTPAGSVTPDLRFYNINDKAKQQNPSGGKAYDLNKGLNRFSFTGQQFGTTGKTLAIDWDLYSINSGDHQFSIGSWGHNNGSRASTQFATANGRPYEQSQYLFHVKGTGGFSTLIVPRRKGTAVSKVHLDGQTLVVTNDKETTRIDEDKYTYTSTDQDILATFSGTSVSAFGLSITGGPTEVVFDKVADVLRITAHGIAGTRIIGVPTNQWYKQNGTILWDKTLGKWVLDYDGGNPGEKEPITIILTRSKQNLP